MLYHYTIDLHTSVVTVSTASMAVLQVKSGFVLEADIKTISRQIIGIVTQVKRDRETKQQQTQPTDAVKDSSHTAATAATVVPAPGVSQAPPSQSVPVGGSVTSSATSLPTPNAAVVATAQQSRPTGAQQPAAALAAAASTAAISTATGCIVNVLHYLFKLNRL